MTFGELLIDANRRADETLGYCDGWFRDAFIAFAERLIAEGMGPMTLDLLTEAERHVELAA